jgi:hypothetical protein
MSTDTKLWILGHPRLLYLPLIGGMVAGVSMGFALGGPRGSELGVMLSTVLVLYGWAFFRRYLLMTSGGTSPAEDPPTEGAPRPAPLRPFPPRILAAHREWAEAVEDD